jgi:hypothetical protein
MYALARLLISRPHLILLLARLGRLVPPFATRSRAYGSDQMALSPGEAADFNTRNDGYFRTRDDYQRAVFLTVYWSEHDLNDDDDLGVPVHKLGDEIKAWQVFFDTVLGFELATCALPSSRFKTAINERLETILDSFGSESNYILVVYYAGHNGINAKGSAELSAFVTVPISSEIHEANAFLVAKLGDQVCLGPSFILTSMQPRATSCSFLTAAMLQRSCTSVSVNPKGDVFY